MIRQNIQNIVENNAQTVTYRRTESTSRAANKLSKTNTTTDYTVKAHFRTYKQSEVAGLVQQGDREMRIAAGSITFTPKPNDTVIDGTRTYKVISVDTRIHKDVLLLHIMNIRGVHDDG